MITSRLYCAAITNDKLKLSKNSLLLRALHIQKIRVDFENSNQI